MHKMPYVLNSIISQLFSEHIYRVLALIATMGLILVSNGAFAADPNMCISVSDARKLFDEMVDNTKEYLKMYF